MTCKLSNSEMQILASTIGVVCHLLGQSADPDDKIYVSIFHELHISLEQRLVLAKKEYSVKLKPYQAIAFWICLNNSNHPNAQARNMIMLLCNSIHKEYLIK